MTHGDQKPRLLTVDDAVARLHEAGLTDLSRKWVQDQIDRGRLPAVVVARKRRVRSDKVDALIAGWLKGAA